ncbi:DUF5667 domain-containing protein [Patescibacteria group bacterium]
MKTTISIIIVLAVLVGGFFMTASQADAAVPGDGLYGFDRAYESVQRFFTSSTNKPEFEMDILDERVDELNQLKASNADLSDIEKSIKNVTDQDDRTAKRVREAEDNTTSDDGTLERIRERLETHQEESLKLMEQVQTKLQTQEKTMTQTEEQIQQQNRIKEKINEYQEQLQNRKNDSGQRSNSSGQGSGQGNN